MDKIKNLLQQVSIIQKKYDEIAKITGENFNIFSVINMENNEVYTHSAIIGELLNPNGSHCQGDVFLKLFVEEIKNKFNSEKHKIELEYFGTLVNDKICERTISIGNNWDDVSGGRIDLIVEDDKQIVIIENKIYAVDQPYQLIRYKNYAKTKSGKKAFLFYLTLDGKDLKKQEEPYIQNDIKIIGSNFKYDKKNEYDNFKIENKELDNIHHCLYYPISFEIHIRDWIEKCLEKTHSLPIIRETLVQYLHLIKKLTNQTTNDKMNLELIKTILSSEANIKSAIEINKINIKQIICDELFKRILTKIGNDLITENYDLNKLFGEYESGMWFSKKEDFKIGVLLWFDTNYELKLGIDVNTDDQDEKQKIRAINKGEVSWIKTIPFEDNFNSLEWEEILEDKNIDGIVIKIKQLIEEVDSFTTE